MDGTTHSKAESQAPHSLIEISQEKGLVFPNQLSLTERVTEISRFAKHLSDELRSLGAEEPTFRYGLPAPLCEHTPTNRSAQTFWQELLHRVDELRALLTQPSLLLTGELRNPLIATHAAVRLGIAEHFPLEGTTVNDLADRLKIGGPTVRRLLTNLATHYIYLEAAPDFFVHTAASRLLAESEGMRMWILLGAEEIIPATLKTADALIKYPESEEPEHSGWSLYNDTTQPIFEALSSLPERATVFAKAMSWHATIPSFSLQYLVEAFPWESVEKENTHTLTVVDVGGGQGHTSLALANSHPSAFFVVEDWPDVVRQGEELLPEQLRERVSFRPHSFFDVQPIVGADVYVLRLVLHNWSDKYAATIIRALIPALKPGARVVVNDRLVPGHGEAGPLMAREARDYDIYMMAFQNGRERTAKEWVALFQEVDPRFSLVKITQTPQSSLAVIEIVWDTVRAV